MAIEPVSFMIDGLLPKVGVSMVFGGSGVGKSFVALDMALSVAYGQEWHGKPVVKGNVVYMAGEGYFGLGQRLAVWKGNQDGSRLDRGRSMASSVPAISPTRRFWLRSSARSRSGRSPT